LQRFGQFQRHVARSKVGERFAQRQHIATLPIEFGICNKLAAFYSRSGNPDVAPDAGLHGDLKGAEIFLRSVKFEAQDECGCHAGRGNIQDFDRERFIGDCPGGPRTIESQFEFAFVLDVFALQGRSEQFKQVGLRE
jgi:hypothetical protein